MRRVELNAFVPGVDPGTVFDGVIRFDRYPGLAPHVQATTVHRTVPGPTGRSSWELHFRSGLLRWTEEERFLRDELRIEFEQDEGDFDRFDGHWALRGRPDGCEVRFRAEFDFGIPSLEGILDPIAERVIKETVAWALVGLFEHTRLSDGVTLPSATPAASA